MRGTGGNALRAAGLAGGTLACCALAFCGLACCGLAGCGTDDSKASTKPREFSEVQLGKVESAGEGMDVEFWVLDLSSPALGRAMSPLSEFQVGGVLGKRWRDNGLRVYRAPSGAVRSVATTLPMQGQARRDSLAMVTRWTPLSGGRAWDSDIEVWLDQEDWGEDSPSATVAISNGKLTLARGALRFLSRAWLVAGTSDPTLDPGAGIPAAMMLELVPQHIPSERSSDSDLLSGPKLNSSRDGGQVFSRLTLDLLCEQGETVIIVPAHPREKWESGPAAESRMASGTSPRPPEPPTILPLPERDPGERVEDSLEHTGETATLEPIGPSVPALLTLGEAMLTDAAVGNFAHRRVLIAITPRMPKRFDPLVSAEIEQRDQRGPVR